MVIFYSKINVFINPIISGKGIRTKVVEAAAHGRPVVTTRLGAEGFDDLKLEIVDTKEDYLKSCGLYFSEEKLKEEACYYNRGVLENKYTTEYVTQQMLHVFKEKA